MRPLRLLLSLCSSLIALTLLLYLVFGADNQQQIRESPATAKKGRFNAFFSFTSPASLFPPSAIISLTDDNSTFFLARPAAFGPSLPSEGLSGPLWIGSGFGDDAMGKGELGCSDVPGWSDGDEGPSTAPKAAKNRRSQSFAESANTPQGRRTLAKATVDDGTDDHLHEHNGKTSEHADIQSLQEAAEIAGKVVLLKRGGCGFLEKVKWAQRRGGVALIVGDDVRGGGLIRMYARGDTSNVSIPALFTSHTTAHLLSSLLPSGGLVKDLSPDDAAKLSLIKSSKGGKTGKKKSKTRPTMANVESKSKQSPVAQTRGAAKTKQEPATRSENPGWFRSFFYTLGFGSAPRPSSTGDSHRPPNSGNLDWVLVEDWDEDLKSSKTKPTNVRPATTPAEDGFVIGEQDWRDPDLLPESSSTKIRSKSSPTPGAKSKGGSVLPGSGEYSTEKVNDRKGKGWLGKLLGDPATDSIDADQEREDESVSLSMNATANALSKGHDNSPDGPPLHEGLWVTLTPTSMSTSPFFDTLLVLVVSPLVTLTVVYALLLLRSRIRRRRWRAPKSVVERLPVRTYHTISDATPAATPDTSSPTTPLLQHSASRPASSSSSHQRPRTVTDVPATSSSFQQSGRTPEEEKREAGLAEWRRRYGGRQKECVVCLEEYVDGISRVMSLPCGHEFHADCITPWLVTRRRTCPICKGDVVRSLSQSYLDRTVQSVSAGRSPRFSDELDSLQIQAAETRNDSPSASRPVPIASSSTAGPAGFYDSDVEANWADNGSEPDDERGIAIPHDRVVDLSGSVRDLSSTVVTTIWRGVDAVRSATGLQRRPSREEVDRDR